MRSPCSVQACVNDALEPFDWNSKHSVRGGAEGSIVIAISHMPFASAYPGTLPLGSLASRTRRRLWRQMSACIGNIISNRSKPYMSTAAPGSDLPGVGGTRVDHVAQGQIATLLRLSQFLARLAAARRQQQEVPQAEPHRRAASGRARRP
jgi:hypothetical protein